MRYGPNDTFWLVTDPTPTSEFGDVLSETTLAGLRNQFAGGLTMAQHPALFTERAEAEREAQGRWVAMKTAETIASRAAEGGVFDGARRITVMDEQGTVIFETELARFIGARG